MKIFTPILFPILFSGIFICPFAAVQTISLPGAGNSIDYDLSAGTYSVYYNDFKVISDAVATANSDRIYNSASFYTSRVYSSTAVSDAFGTGVRHAVTLSGGGQLQMQQVFYVYNGKPWFYAENVLAGAGSNCYAMSPMTTNSANIKETGDTRALFVPFDNDAWVRYDAKQLSSANFTSSEVIALYDDVSRKGLVVGSVEHDDWKTGVAVTGSSAQTLSRLSVFGGFTDSSITRDKRGHGWVNVGGTQCTSPKIMVGFFDDWRTGLEEYGASNRLAEPRFVATWKKGTPFGWNSWGAIQAGLSLVKAKAVVDFFSNSCTGFRNDNTLYMDLDSYWDNLTDADLTSFCDYCKGKGLTPGIYWAPFVDWATWDRQIEGSSYLYSTIWTKVNGGVFSLDGSRAIDPTHPGTKDRIRYFVNRFKAAGFQMIKLDFLGHAAIEADGFYAADVHTGMQAFRNGMEYLCGQLGGQMLIYASISPNLATGRYAHMRRIACDSYKSISETQYTLNSTNYGWWQSAVYNFIDADHVVFGTESLGANRARLASSVVTGTLMTGDDYSTSGAWASRAQSLLQNQDVLAIAKNGRAFRPVRGNTGTNPNELFVQTVGNFLYCAVFNYGNAAKTFSINTGAIGSDTSATYSSVKELFTGAVTSVNSVFSATVNASDVAIYRFEKSAAPVVSRIATPSLDDARFRVRCDPSGKIRVVSDGRCIESIRVFNAIGRVVCSMQGIRQKAMDFTAAGWTAGIYIVEIRLEKGPETYINFIKN